MNDEVKKMSLFNRPGGYMYGLEWDGGTTVSFVRLVTPNPNYPAENVMACHDLHYDTHVIKDIVADQARQAVFIKTGDGLVDKYDFDEIENFFYKGQAEEDDVTLTQLYPEEEDKEEHPSFYLFRLQELYFYVRQTSDKEMEFWSAEIDSAPKSHKVIKFSNNIKSIQVTPIEENDVIVRVTNEEGLMFVYTKHDIVSRLYWEDKPVKKEKEDLVNHPSHYQSNQGIEVIQVIGAFTEGLEGMEAVCTANVLKYTCRWKKKNGIEDLKKAEWYLKKLIDIKEAESK